MSNSKVVYEGPMFRYGRKRMIGRSNLHTRYFVLYHNLLAYYKKKPKGKQVPIKSLLINGNCRVEDGSLTVHRDMVYVLYIYNKKEKNKCISMAAFSIEEALMWKKKIEFIIDQHQELALASVLHNGRSSSSSDQESQYDAQEDMDDSHLNLSRTTTVGNDPSEGLLDHTWEVNSEWSSDYNNTQAFSSRRWRLLQCQNGLRIFEELGDDDYLPRSCSRAMKAVGVVEATCEEIFRLVMSLDGTRFEWDCSFQMGRLVEEVDGHRAILYHRLQLDWFPALIWPRDLCYVRYWRRNEDGSYVVVFRSQEHERCGPEPGCVRAHVESGGFNISPLKPQNGRPRAKVQYLMQIDLKGWSVAYIRSFQLHCLLQMLNGVAGLRELFAQTDKKVASQSISVMFNLTSTPISSPKANKPAESSVHSLDQSNNGSRNSVPLEDSSDDDDEEFQMADMGEEEFLVAPAEDATTTAMEKQVDHIDLSCFRGNLRYDDRDKSRNCWRISDGNNFRVRSKKFLMDKSKIPAGKHLMDLVAVDWFKDTRRMDHVARRRGCAAQVASEKGLFTLIINVQVPGSTHYSMVFYFVSKELVPGSLLQQFVDMDDEFRNSRFKLIPSVPQGSWIVRQSVGSTPCLLGKAVDCNYIRGPRYLEIDIDIGSSTVARGVLGLVFGVITTLVVDMAFLVQANTTEELPERLIGAVRVSHIELSSAIVPQLDTEA